ncbi:MAG: RNA methyltransferase [Pseudomonadota bacterium]
MDRKPKPAWAVARERERERRSAAPQRLWLFGLHAVRAALDNPARRLHRLIVTTNAADRLADSIAAGRVAPEAADARRFPAPLDPGSVHQGAALETEPLIWPSLSELCAPRGAVPLLVLLDRVSDPHNVGAVLRSAAVFGARAVIAPARHSAPETGALAKAASGALEGQPYLRVRNLATSMQVLGDMGYRLIGLDGDADMALSAALDRDPGVPTALVLGAEGSGLRPLTRTRCSALASLGVRGGFSSLNVSNAAAVALYAARETLDGTEASPGAASRRRVSAE